MALSLIRVTAQNASEASHIYAASYHRHIWMPSLRSAGPRY